MKSLMAFIKKEWMQQMRSGTLLFLGILFLLFGIMNPAIAKMTPWIMEMMAESLEGSGLIVQEVEITALDSWMQFYKNYPVLLIAFVLIQSSIFTKEYSVGTLIPALTKGLNRYKVVLAKASVLLVLWTVGYWLYFGITYGYNSYYWDNGIAKNLGFSVVCGWLFGIWIVSLMVFFSVLAKSNITVLGGTGVVAFGCYLLGMLPKVKPYMPSLLMDVTSLIFGKEDTKAYVWAIVIAIVLTILAFVASIQIMNRKKL